MSPGHLRPARMQAILLPNDSAFEIHAMTRRPLSAVLSAAPSAALRVAVCGSLLLSLSACGGGDVAIGGTVTGLPTGNTVTLQNNGTDDITVGANGSFWFSDTIADGETYSVTVKTQPADATCTVTSGSGTVSSSSSSTTTQIDTVVVTCVAD